MIGTDKEKEETTDTEKVYFQKVEEIELYFGKKPCEAVRTDLKEHNWGWHLTKKCWYNEYSEENAYLVTDYWFANYGVAVLGKKNCIKAETKINEQILKPKKKESFNKHIKITPLGGYKKHADSLI